jgi:hypothetical protein
MRRLTSTGLVTLTFAALVTGGCGTETDVYTTEEEPAAPCGADTVATVATGQGSMVAFCAMTDDSGPHELIVELVAPGEEPVLTNDPEGLVDRQCGLRTFLSLTNDETPVPQALVDACAEDEGIDRVLAARRVFQGPVLLAPDPEVEQEAGAAGQQLEGGDYRMQGTARLPLYAPAGGYCGYGEDVSMLWMVEQCHDSFRTCMAYPYWGQHHESSWLSSGTGSWLSVASCDAPMVVGSSSAKFGFWTATFQTWVPTNYFASFVNDPGWPRWASEVAWHLGTSYGYTRFTTYY